MSIQVSGWVSKFAEFFLAALACSVLSQRGHLSLHIPSVMGVGAYVFAACGQVGLSPLGGAAVGVLGAIVFAIVSGIVFLKTRGATAALASIGIQLIFEEYVRGASWTGGTEGLWQGIPEVSPVHKVFISAGVVLLCCLFFRFFQTRVAARLLVLDGYTPILSKSTGVKVVIPLLVANGVVGLASGCGGLVLSLQMGSITPANFDLYRSILYVSVILLVGYDNLGSIAIGAFLFGTLSEILRAFGLGSVEYSAWRGFIVGVIVFAMVILQAPRQSFSQKGRRDGKYGNDATDGQ